MNPIVAKGQSVSLTIKRLGINGEGIGYYKRLTIFVPGALPKEKVLARVNQVTPKYAQAELIKIQQPSPHRVTPPCPVYDICGGCQLQHLSYTKQLDFKKDLLRQALEKFKPAGYQDYRLKQTIGMEEPWHYRNKAQFQLRYNPRSKKIEAGLYQPNSHQLVALTDCLVQEPATQKVMNTVVQVLNKYQTPIYDERKKQGVLRTIMVRVGIHSKQLQVVLISHQKQVPQQATLIREISTRCPEVVSIVLNIQNKNTSVVMGEETIVLWGKESIEEKILDIPFDLSARAFFQLNPKQTEILYQEGLKALDLQKDETVIDAYCGVGTIGLALAKHAKEVRGMDIIAQAVEDAKRNAERLGLDNTHYETGKAEDLIPAWYAKGFRADCIVVDPPRTGLDSKLLQTLIHYPPKKLAYISCNVSTLARDLVELAKVFDIHYLQSVDMFPQTARCEVVVKLTRKK